METIVFGQLGMESGDQSSTLAKCDGGPIVSGIGRIIVIDDVRVVRYGKMVGSETCQDLDCGCRWKRGWKDGYDEWRANEDAREWSV